MTKYSYVHLKCAKCGSKIGIIHFNMKLSKIPNSNPISEVIKKDEFSGKIYCYNCYFDGEEEIQCKEDG